MILPKAKFAVPDERPPDVRPIINIAQDGRMVFKGNDYYTPDKGENMKGIQQLLLEWKMTIPNLDVAPHPDGNPNHKMVNDPVLIRADKWTEWHYVGLFMTACSQPQAAFWKLELALSEVDKEENMMKGR